MGQSFDDGKQALDLQTGNLPSREEIGSPGKPMEVYTYLLEKEVDCEGCEVRDGRIFIKTNESSETKEIPLPSGMSTAFVPLILDEREWYAYIDCDIDEGTWVVASTEAAEKLSDLQRQLESIKSQAKEILEGGKTRE